MNHIPPLLAAIYHHCHNLADLQQNSILHVEKKPDKTFVTNLDKEINMKLEKDILEYLHGFDQEARVVAEESWKGGNVKNGSRRDLKEGLVVYIDPIDGTHAFIDGGDDWCVMCGMAQNGIPMLGIVWAPRMDALWIAVKGRGAYQLNNEQFEEWYKAWKGESTAETSGNNKAQSSRSLSSLPHDKSCPHLFGKSIHIDEVEKLEDAAVLRSSTRPLKALDTFLENNKISNQRSLASMGVKCGLIARGDWQLYVNSSCSYWDSCGPRVILEEAGGLMTKADGEKVVYDGLSAEHKYLQVCGTPRMVRSLCGYLCRDL